MQTTPVLAYVPSIAHNQPITTDLLRAHVRGPLCHPFGGDWWQCMDVASRAARGLLRTRELPVRGFGKCL